MEGLFDNVKTADFHEKVYDQILAVSSRESEKIDLVKPVMAQGNVELWLGELMKTIFKSLHSIIRTSSIAIGDKENFKLIEFENTYPAQVGLLGLQMLWTRDSEDALKLARSDKKVKVHQIVKRYMVPHNIIGIILQNCSSTIPCRKMLNVEAS